MLGEIYWETGHIHRFSDEMRIREFWKTLIGDRTRDEKGIDEVQFRQMFDVARGASSIPESFVKPFSDKEEAFQRFVAPFQRECGDIIFNRRFFTSGHAVMGLCSPTAQPGDKIAILAGCAFPVLLRSVGENFEFHGEAYVSGFMDGQVVELLKTRTVEFQKFSIQ